MYKVIGTDGQQYGPVSTEHLKRWIAEGRINAQTLTQLEGAVEWKPLNAFPELAGETRSAPPPLTTSQSPTPAQKTIVDKASTKVAAGICGILLGWLGVHKFILGYTGAGLIMLLVSTVGGIMTCGVASSVMWIIGLIEGIVYLTKSDEEFVRTYVDGRKEWF